MLVDAHGEESRIIMGVSKTLSAEEHTTKATYPLKSAVRVRASMLMMMMMMMKIRVRGTSRTAL